MSNKLSNQRDENNQHRFWHREDDVIVIKNRRYSIFYISLIATIIKVGSIAALGFSILTYMVVQTIPSMIAVLIAGLTLASGFYIGGIAKKANGYYLADLSKTVEKEFAQRIRDIKENRYIYED